jgi:hypothetical protein
VIPLRSPPGELAGFPAYQLEPTRILYGIHRKGRSPWWFSNDGSGRFDLSGGQGTCYVAERPIGAFIEVFRTGTLIPDAEVQVRLLASLRVSSEAMLADCTAGESRRFGVTDAIHSQPEYDLTRAWAQALADAGFDGFLYRLSHDPSTSELGLALFGGAGEHELAVESSGPIAPEIVEEARARFGLLVIPVPHTSV